MNNFVNGSAGESVYIQCESNPSKKGYSEMHRTLCRAIDRLFQVVATKENADIASDHLPPNLKLTVSFEEKKFIPVMAEGEYILFSLRKRVYNVRDRK